MFGEKKTFLLSFLRQKNQKIYVQFLVTLCVIFLSSCSVNTQKNINDDPFENPDDAISIEEDTDFNPTDGANPVDNETENCQPFGEITVSPAQVDFDLHELNYKECHTITTSSCLNFSAELTSDSSEQFGLFNLAGNEISGRAESQQDSIQVCYKRLQTGSHVGQVNVVVEGDTTVYAYGIPLSGKTVEPFLNINTPSEGQLIWENDNFSSFKNGRFYFPTNGTLNSQLDEIITAFNLTISVDETSQTLDVSNHQFSTELSVAENPQVYPINYSIETTHGTFVKTVNVIRYFRPEASVEVKNATGRLVNEDTLEDAEEVDDSTLTAGIFVNNLEVSGPSENHPVRIKLQIKKEDGRYLTYLGDRWSLYHGETSNEEFDYFINMNTNDDSGVNGRCDEKIFGNVDKTFCVDLPPTAILGKGANEIQITLCNGYTDVFKPCTTINSVFIVDNDLPIITLTSPQENQVIAEDKDITITGELENFILTTQEKVEDSEEVIDVCAVNLWLNTSVDQAPIELCNYITIVSDVDEDADSGNLNNIKKATFSYPVSINGDANGFNKPTLYTNLIYIKTVDAKSHNAYKTLSFQIGNLKESVINTTKRIGDYDVNGDLLTSLMGSISNLDGSTQQTPLMIHLSKGSFENNNIKVVIEQLLNDNLKFSDLVQGGTMPGDNNGNNRQDAHENIDFEKDLNLNSNENFWDLKDEDQEKWIWQNLHASMPQRVRALSRYRTLKNLRDEAKLDQLENVFFKGKCDERNPANFEEGWNVACDSCGNLISTAIVTYDTYQYIYKDIYKDIESVSDFHPEWPKVFGNDLNANDTIQGKWKIGNLKLKNDGFIDAEICLVGEGDITDGCDDVKDNNFHSPAFWGHAAAIGLVERGVTGLENDPTMPFIWNVAKVKIDLENALQIKKIKTADGSYTNKLFIYKDKMIEGLYGSIELEPYLECHDFYHSQFGKKVETPFGCNPQGEVFPILIERNSTAGQAIWADIGDEGKNPFIIEIFRNKLLDTFRNILSCMDSEVVNPIINPQEFPYQPWVTNDTKIDDLSVALGTNNKGDLTFGLEEDLANPVVGIKPDLKNSDIIANPDGITLKLPTQIKASNITIPRIVKRPGGRIEEEVLKRDWGYMFRNINASKDLDSLYPLTEVENSPYLSASIGIEELVNGAAHILWKQDLNKLLSLFDIDEFDATESTLNIDKVTLGRLGICGQIDIANTNFAPSIFFKDIAGLFEDQFTHLNISLDKNQPVTLNMQPVKDSENNMDPEARLIEVGISNIQVNVRSLIADENNSQLYTIGNSVVTLRLDLILRVVLKYLEDQKRLEIYILPFDQQTFYLSVPHKGYTYDDEIVINSIRDVVLKSQLWPKLSQSYKIISPNNNETDVNKPGIAINFPNGLSDFGNQTQLDEFIIENNLPETVIGECGPGEAPEYKDRNDNQRDVIPPQDADDDTSDSPFDLERAEINENPSDPFEEISENPCAVYDIPNIEDNAIKEAFCDLGINEIYLTDGFPHIQLDFENGYIHFSTGINVELLEDSNND